MKARVTEELLEQIRSKSKSGRLEIGDAINRVLGSWGRPHGYSGIGIRRLTKTIYERRVGLDDRLAFVFIATPAELAPRMKTSRASLDRMLDPSNPSLTVASLGKAAAALGRKVELRFGPA